MPRNPLSQLRNETKKTAEQLKFSGNLSFFYSFAKLLCSVSSSSINSSSISSVNLSYRV